LLLLPKKLPPFPQIKDYNFDKSSKPLNLRRKRGYPEFGVSFICFTVQLNISEIKGGKWE
jgi:hypothetical protein